MVPSKAGKRTNRGVALIIAISVLAILTTLIMGLAYSADQARQGELLSSTNDRAGHLTRLGFDVAVATLAATPSTAAAAKDLDVTLQEGTCHVSLRPTAAAEPIYAGNFIKMREGDVLVKVLATIRKGAATQKATHTYLLNINPAHPRRILCEESISKMELPKKP